LGALPWQSVHCDFCLWCSQMELRSQSSHLLLMIHSPGTASSASRVRTRRCRHSPCKYSCASRVRSRRRCHSPCNSSSASRVRTRRCRHSPCKCSSTSHVRTRRCCCRLCNGPCGAGVGTAVLVRARSSKMGPRALLPSIRVSATRRGRQSCRAGRPVQAGHRCRDVSRLSPLPSQTVRSPRI